MPRLFRGWVVAGAAFVVLLVAYGAQYSFGVFFAALLEEFGWRRASLAGAFGLYTVVYCVTGFPAGRLTDRWGPRAVITAGGLLLGGAMAAMGSVTRLWEPYVLYGLLAALGMGTAYVPCNATVVKWFVRRRGLAVGLASSGAGVGAFVGPALAQVLIDGVGWRRAYALLGLGVGVALVAVAQAMRRDPESVGLHPDGDPGAPPVTGTGEAWPLRRVLAQPLVWRMIAAFGATWLPVFIPLVHVARHGRDLGFPPLAGASLVSALGAGAIAGRFLMAAISDRLGRQATLGLSMALQSVAFAALALARTLPALWASAVLFGFSYGAISALFPAFVGDVFGRERAGALVGVIFGIAGATGGVGALVAGLVHDATGAYTLAFALGAALNLAALALLRGCRPPRPDGPWPAPPDQPQPENTAT